MMPARSNMTTNSLFHNEIGDPRTEMHLCGFSHHARLIAFLNMTFARPFSFMCARRKEGLAHQIRE